MSIAAHDTPYTIDEPLRERDMATVYRGTDTLSGQPAFVALLTDYASTDRAMLAALRAELPLLQKADPALLTLFDYNLDNSTPYITAEALEGSSLRQIVESAGKGLPPADALAYCSAAARSVFALHSRGAVHGALHIDSLVMSGSTLKLITPWVAEVFGDDLFAGGAQSPVPEFQDRHIYLPPEQVLRAGQIPTAAGDIYGLGVLLFHLLTGMAPGVSPGSPEVAPWLRGGKTPPLGESITDATMRARLQKLIAVATAGDPMRRWPDAKTFVAALEQIRPGGMAALPRTAPLPPTPTIRGVHVEPKPTQQPQQPQRPQQSQKPPDSAPPLAQPQAQPQVCYLISSATGATYMVSAPGTSIGVARTTDFFPGVNLALEPSSIAQYISQHHADLFYQEGQWHIHRNSTARNPTFVDGHEMAPGANHPLQEGSVLEIPALRLIFRFNSV
ncbi:MAG TPA: FHA domain-containing protein [Chloroflexia bacterium]|jgi:serine/threonine protein kinase